MARPGAQDCHVVGRLQCHRFVRAQPCQYDGAAFVQHCHHLSPGADALHVHRIGCRLAPMPGAWLKAQLVRSHRSQVICAIPGDMLVQPGDPPWVRVGRVRLDSAGIYHVRRDGEQPIREGRIGCPQMISQRVVIDHLHPLQPDHFAPSPRSHDALRADLVVYPGDVIGRPFVPTVALHAGSQPYDPVAVRLLFPPGGQARLHRFVIGDEHTICAEGDGRGCE